MIKNSNRQSNKLKFLACLPLMIMLIICFSLDTPTLAQSEDAIVKENPQAGNIYLAKASDNEMTIKPDGQRRTDQEIIDYIIQKNAEEGKTVTEDRIFLITKADLSRNLNGGSSKDHPEFDGYSRVWLSANGRIGVSTKSDKPKELKGLKVLSFDATINKPLGKKEGKDEYKSMYLNYKGDTLNQAALDYIQGIESQYRKLASIIITNIVVESENKKYIISKESKLDLIF